MTAILITAALGLDLVTANGASEWNPIVKRIMDDAPLLAVIVKLAEIVLVVTTVAICRRRYPRLAGLVAAVAVLAGGVGALSNLPL